ncbi:MAG: alkaline phosphatase family protein [Anaerolineae bacterium]|nr:alkaline phosphatase family protein [Anaerolineae bacterium]
MARRIIVVMFDGCRPDGLAQAQTPWLDALMLEGTHTWSAQTVVPSDTLPAHMSLFRGVLPEKHGVQTNTAAASAYAFPGIMDLAHQAGLHTAMFYSWEELRDLSAPGSLNMSFCLTWRDDRDTDAVIAEHAAAYLIAEQPALTLVYFARPDWTGHNAGWMSPAYVEAIAQTDRNASRLFAALAAAQVRENFTVLFLADHGGHGKGHGTASPEDTTIPWLLTGPGIRRNHRLTMPVPIIDTAPTLAYLLGLPPAPDWEGQPVWEALAQQSLQEDAA